MYHDLKKIYRWDGLKKDIAEYVAKCPNCQQVKEEHLKRDGFTQLNEVLTWKWEAINMDFVVVLPRTRGSMTPYGLLWTDLLSLPTLSL